MKRLIFTLCMGVFCTPLFSQKWEWGLQTGFLGYSGDLTQQNPSIHSFGLAGGLTVRYRFHPQVALRAGILYGRTGASDSKNKDTLLQRRNLSFKSNIADAHLAIEVNLIDPADTKTYPYIFAGVGVFHFDPYAFDDNNQKVFLKPLSTEGQGLTEYPDRKNYNLTQFCIPFGGGVRADLKPNLSLAFELGIRKTFTDYLDDVSSTYIDFNVLQAHRGDKAVEMAFRALTPAGVQAEPVTGDIRGNPGKKDLYYFMGFKLILRKPPPKKSEK